MQEKVKIIYDPVHRLLQVNGVRFSRVHTLHPYGREGANEFTVPIKNLTSENLTKKKVKMNQT